MTSPVDQPPLRHQLHLYTGEGKGKTTSCVGLAVRAAGTGHKVAFIQFDKGYDGTVEHYAERHILRTLPTVRLEPTGRERMMPDGRFRFGVQPEDRAEAARALSLTEEVLQPGAFDLVILDEALSAQQYHLITEAELTGIVDRWEQAGRPCELVLSGRTKLTSIVERADLVTEMRKVKHYFDVGIPARPGIEY